MIEKARTALLAAYRAMEGAPAPNEIDRQRGAFLTRYGPERLAGLSGTELLQAVHGGGRRDGLFYDLEFAEAYAPFGNIGGGSALKFKVYAAADGSGYRKKGPRNLPVPCGETEAANMTADIVT